MIAGLPVCRVINMYLFVYIMLFKCQSAILYDPKKIHIDI